VQREHDLLVSERESGSGLRCERMSDVYQK
jgi:hypothetical protein